MFSGLASAPPPATVGGLNVSREDPAVIKQAVMALALAMLGTSALAGPSLWYVTPAQQGDCGAECYSPPAAWIDDQAAAYEFGVSCDGMMILGGQALAMANAPFEEIEMMIDGRSLGRFSVHSGLNDIYVSPLDPAAQSPGAIRAALTSGGTLELRPPGGTRLNFTLSGSRAAIGLMEQLCRS